MLIVSVGLAVTVSVHIQVAAIVVAVTAMASLATLWPRGRRTMLFSLPLSLPLLAFFSQAALILVYQIPTVYYSDFRSIKSKLEQNPDVEVVDTWTHEDITLEDFGFTLKLKDGSRIELHFLEGHVWHGLFSKVDGIALGQNGSWYEYDRCIRTRDLEAHGISVETLPDLLNRMPEILKIAHSISTVQLPENEPNIAYVRSPPLSEPARGAR